MVIQSKTYHDEVLKIVAEEIEVQNNNKIYICRAYKDNRLIGRTMFFNSYEKACKYAELKTKGAKCK